MDPNIHRFSDNVMMSLQQGHGANGSGVKASAVAYLTFRGNAGVSHILAFLGTDNPGTTNSRTTRLRAARAIPVHTHY